MADHAALALFAAIAERDRFRAHTDHPFTLCTKVQRARQMIAVDINVSVAEGCREQVGGNDSNLLIVFY
ncbi:hypothetical protein HMPREF1618_02329, partial [Escherichia coli 908691]